MAETRETIEAWIRGIESGLWDPTPATKHALAQVLRDYIGPPPGLKTHSHYDWRRVGDHYGPCERPLAAARLAGSEAP